MERERPAASNGPQSSERLSHGRTNTGREVPGQLAKDYVEADLEDRLPMDATVERCLSDAELAGLPKDDVVEAAGGDVAAYLTEALEEFNNKKAKNDGR